jgi:hypothetical protein
VSAIARVADFWDHHTATWLDGEDQLPAELVPWFASYQGRGAGSVTCEAFAEPYGGDIRGSPRFVILGLNPGAAALEFQARDGVFADALRRTGSYSAWAASHPYLGDEWTRAHGRNRYGAARLRFARAWLKEPNLPAQDLLTLELYPWHSTRVTAPIVPPRPIVEEFIWEPLADLAVELVFAFGKPWLDVCKQLGLREISHWGRGGDDFGSIVPSRAIVVFELPSHQRVVIVWQSGYAGPPGPDDTERLRWLLR